MEQYNKIMQGDSLAVTKTMPNKSVNCVVTSPPYWGLRDYQVDNQFGNEKTPEDYVNYLVKLFREIKRVLKDDGTVWLNIGDSYAYSGGTGWTGLESKNFKQKSQPRRVKALKPKDLVGIPWMVAFALRADGWYLRQDIIWAKPNPMPESVTDRCTKSHEYIFLLSKSQKYYYDTEAIKEEATGYDGRKDTMMKGSNKYKNSVVPGKKEHTMASNGHERWKFKERGFKSKENNIGQSPQHHGADINVYPVRNKRSVWTVSTKPFKGSHFAVYPQELIKDCIKAGCPKNGIVFDPFMGAGTTAIVARKLGRNYIGIELNPEYIEIAEKRIYDELGMFV